MANASPKGTTLMMICAIAEERPMCELKGNVRVERREQGSEATLASVRFRTRC
jgi:hypothetical protein